ncbi:MAG: primosomal protein N' [Anaplasma ovis]|uniref:Replication restart protein PriA n=1 Tax=Anaplasma ovis str. Haibei TaxID=1248439 RepID=A0A2Z2LGJ5_9RICK|nr:primosomal protein N' [Anaplasma ovis]ASI47783.1 primosomal protein N' [Anaplasma ovis str. Haibei]
MTEPIIAEVALPVPVDRCFYYSVREGMELSVGDYVRVPFGNRVAVGIITTMRRGPTPDMELKDIGDRIPLPPVQRPLMEFLKWVSNYNIMPIGMVLKMVLGGVIAAKSCMFGTQEYKRCVPTGDGHGLSASAELSGEQLKACDQIVGRLSGFSVTVLDGKTGSGKTEVYCTAIAKLLHSCLDAQILILLPEIVLATQLMKRVHNYFAGYNPVEWHSGLTAKKRRENWLAITYGASSIVVGARSALFLPFKNLKLIVVDEEHESSFKQDCGIIYNARDMSIVLAKQLGVPVVLCSATPALETMHNVHQGKYHHVVLKQRFGEAVMPDIAVVDMRKDQLLREWLSSGLHDKIASTLAKGNQAMLFLNRRGYARLVLCKKCGYKISCPNCCTWLTEHKRLDGLLCHYCAYSCAVPQQCPDCTKHNTMTPYGVGVERVAEGIKELVPKAKVAIISSDVSTKRITRAIEQIMEGEVNVIVGTQIIAKGHNFPKLTLVGVIDADLGMGNSDLRATEKTYQLLHQVSGRSGRFEEKGEVVLQTHGPESPVIQSLLSCEREDFYSAELHSRKVTDMPPYTRLVAIIVSGKEEFRVVDVSKDIVADLSRHITVWGPAPAPMSLVNGVHRYRMLIKTRSIMAVRKILAECRDRYTKLGRVKVVIDVDPVNFA